MLEADLIERNSAKKDLGGQQFGQQWALVAKKANDALKRLTSWSQERILLHIERPGTTAQPEEEKIERGSYRCL